MSEAGKTGDLLNTVGAAAEIGVGPSTIRYWILTGALQAERIGGRWAIDPKDLERADERMRTKRTRGRGRGPRGRLVMEPQNE